MTVDYSKEAQRAEDRYEGAAIVIDPQDYYALPLESQAILDTLMGAMGLDRDYVTMIAIDEGGGVGVWHHTKGAEDQYLREWRREAHTDTPLGNMGRGDV